MTIRNFVQHGAAYGTTSCKVVAKIDGQVIFDGEEPVAGPQVPGLPGDGPYIISDLFSWTDEVEFSGTRQLEVTVQDAYLVYAATYADHTIMLDTSLYSAFYEYTLDGQTILDPLSDVKINGVAQNVEQLRLEKQLYGQWFWVLPPGSVLTATININPGVYIPSWNAQQTYQLDDIVRYRLTESTSYIYQAIANVSPGIVPTDTAYWTNLSVPVLE